MILILYLYYRKAADRITDYYNGLMSVNCKPLTMGGDHFVSYPILRAIAAKHGPVCRIFLSEKKYNQVVGRLDPLWARKFKKVQAKKTREIK